MANKCDCHIKGFKLCMKGGCLRMVGLQESEVKVLDARDEDMT